MSPEKIRVKKPFIVPVPDAGAVASTLAAQPQQGQIPSLVPFDKLDYVLTTQADFLRQWYPSSHQINSLVYYPNQISMSEGKYQAKVHTRVAIAYQQMIKTKRKVALLGNNIGMRLVTNKNDQKQLDTLAIIREGWEEYNFEIGIDRCMDDDFITAECAIYVFIADNKPMWRTFSYRDGDILYPHFHPMTGQITLLGREYSVEEEGTTRKYLDVIDDKYFATYSCDGGEWNLVGQPVKHGFPFCPVAYKRSHGPVWYPSQSLIESQEIGLSQFAENNLSYGLRILYTLGAEFNLETDVDGTPMHIDSPDQNSKVGFLENASGADGAFAKQLEIGHKNIMRCSFAVETPEVKSGADMSSLTVKMLFADSYIKAIEDSQAYQIFLDRVMELFKYAYGITSGKKSLIDNTRVKAYLDPFVFMSDTEVINALVQLTAAGVLSKRTATEIAYNSGYGVANEYERVLQQEHDELVAESKASAQTQQTAQNPVAASRLNNA